MSSQEWSSEGNQRLIEFLRAQLPGWKRSTIEQRLRDGCVEVNGTVVQRNDLLGPGSTVRMVERGEARGKRVVEAPFPLLHQDAWLVAIDKPSGLLSVSSATERERTAMAQLQEALARNTPGAKVWPCHRLDRETSGVLLFAKSREGQAWVQQAWDQVQKCYLAVVQGTPRDREGVVDQPLFEDAILGVQVGEGHGAKEARTHYRVVSVHKGRSLLEVQLDTGRRHQIRAHLAWLGHPVVGDPRYGEKARRMGLHALSLELRHPGNGRPLRIEAPPPPAFEQLLR